MEKISKNIFNVAIAGSLETDTGQKTSTLVEQIESLKDINIMAVYSKDIKEAELILKKANLKGSFIIILGLLYLWGAICWFDRYFFHYLNRFPYAWPTGFKEAIIKADKEIPNSTPICLQTNHDQPYVLTLFYLKYPPSLIQQEIKLTAPDEFGFSTVEHFGRFYFDNCDSMPESGVIINDDSIIKRNNS